MKRPVVIAIVTGIIVSALVAAIEAKMPNTLTEVLLLPGFFVIVLRWGPHGGNVSDLAAEAVMISVNAVVYGLIAFGIFKIAGRISRKA